MVVTPEAFRLWGFRMIHRGRRSRNRGVGKGEERRYSAHFGTTWDIVYQIWVLLDDLPCGARLLHLLWALFHCKVYSTEEVLSGIAGCDEKTFRKWSSIFREAITMAIDKVVSCLLFVFCFLL